MTRFRKLLITGTVALAPGVMLLAAAGLLLLASTPPALAQSFTVQSGQTVGAQTMNNAGDTGTVEAGGTIDNGGVGDGVTMNNAGQTVTNDGLVTTTGLAADGIFSTGANAAITSSGAITTTGTAAFGIFSTGANAAITSSGTITTTGLGAEGITASGADPAITHTGTITTTGTSAHGIVSGGANAAITSSGTITTTGDVAVGIFLSGGANAAITHTGTITTTGANADGITSSGANGQVTNSGRIVSAQDSAIDFSGAENNVLTLLPGSVLQGGLAFGGGTDTLIIGNGLSISNTFDKAPESLNSNGAPFAVSGTQVAVVDPTTLSTQEEMFHDLTGGIFSTVRNRLNGLRNGVAGVTTNPRPMYVAGSRDGGAVEAGREYWVQGFGSYRDQAGDGPSLDTDQRVAGVVSGMDAHYSAYTRAGFFLGGSWGEVEHVLDTQESDIDSFYGGVYASTLRGRTAIDIALLAGWSDYDRERQVANNLTPGGLQTAEADYDGWFISPEITFTRPFWPLGQRIEKVVTLRYAGLFLDGFTETGAADAFSVGDRDIHLAVGRAALALPVERQSEDGGLSRFTLTGGIEGRAQFGDDTLSGALLAQSIVFDPGGDGSVIAGFANVTGEHTTPGGVTAFVALEGRIEDGGTHQISARGGIRVRF